MLIFQILTVVRRSMYRNGLTWSSMQLYLGKLESHKISLRFRAVWQLVRFFQPGIWTSDLLPPSTKQVRLLVLFKSNFLRFWK